jgi:hypothetical protein
LKQVDTFTTGAVIYMDLWNTVLGLCGNEEILHQGMKFAVSFEKCIKVLVDGLIVNHSYSPLFRI